MRADRNPAEISLLAVSKTWPAADLRAAARAGQSSFGESYAQEALAKQADLADLALEWHFIGPLQSNKTRPVAENFAWAHSVDRYKIAERLASQRPAAMPPLQVCLQVNVSGEPTKSGCPIEQALDLVTAISELPGLQVRGLMAIPEPSNDERAQRQQFNRVRRCLERINDETGYALDTLSMGMSHDLEAAIIEGATIVRIGTAIFGNRIHS